MGDVLLDALEALTELILVDKRDLACWGMVVPGPLSSLSSPTTMSPPPHIAWDILLQLKRRGEG